NCTLATLGPNILSITIHSLPVTGAIMTHPMHRTTATRREVLVSATGLAIGLSLTAGPVAAEMSAANTNTGASAMSKINLKDGVEIYYKDWGPKNAQPVVFHHGWPLSSDDWDAQMLFFLDKGFRVIAHDR